MWKKVVEATNVVGDKVNQNVDQMGRNLKKLELKNLESAKFAAFGAADLFAIPVSIFATRRKQFSGSAAGFIFTGIFVILILAFLLGKW